MFCRGSFRKAVATSGKGIRKGERERMVVKEILIPVTSVVAEYTENCKERKKSSLNRS